MNTIEGLFILAKAKSCLISLSDSPNHLLTKSAELTEKNVLPTEASVAHALAKYDFPVPGGP